MIESVVETLRDEWVLEEDLVTRRVIRLVASYADACASFNSSCLEVNNSWTRKGQLPNCESEFRGEGCRTVRTEDPWWEVEFAGSISYFRQTSFRAMELKDM
jgi:hypothetical protein